MPMGFGVRVPARLGLSWSLIFPLVTLSFLMH